MIVPLDTDTWVQRYPEFKGIAAPVIGLYAAEAQLYCGGVLARTCDPAQQQMLLGMVTAHVAQLAQCDSTVGRITDATEGSVSISTEYASETPGSMAWYVQTKYGAAYWQATLRFRTMRFAPGVQRPADPYAPYGIPPGNRWP